MDGQNSKADNFPQGEFENVCFHSISIIDQNREYLQMHLRDVADLPARQALSDIQVETARLERAVQNAMTLARLRRDETETPELYDLCSLLEKAGALAQDAETALRLRLKTEDDGAGECFVMAVPDEAELLLLHLLSNAFCACGERGHVWVRLKRENGSAVLCVEDDGCGLPEEAPLENHRRFLGGTGMGLEICRLICLRAGWQLTLTPRPGGTCAQVLFPLASDKDIPAVMEFHSAAENEFRKTRFVSRAGREILLLRKY